MCGKHPFCVVLGVDNSEGCERCRRLDQNIFEETGEGDVLADPQLWLQQPGLLLKFAVRADDSYPSIHEQAALVSLPLPSLGHVAEAMVLEGYAAQQDLRYDGTKIAFGKKTRAE